MRFLKSFIASSLVVASLVIAGSVSAAEEPGNISVLAGDGQVTVSFTRPTDAPGQIADFELLSYRINVYQLSTLVGSTICPKGTISNESCTVSTYTATSGGSQILVNGTEYIFEVIAVWKRLSDSTEFEGDPSVRSTAISPYTIPDVPSAPTAVVDSTTATSVDVSWTAPASNGASINSYSVQVWNKAGTSQISQISGCTTPTLTCEVSGLSYGTSYTFKVSATNTAGASDFSVASNAVVIVPDQPSGVSLTRLTSPAPAIRVSWNEPANNAEPVLSYEIAFTPSQGTAVTKTFTVDGDALEIDFTAGATGDSRDLTFGTTYSVTVTGTNDGGEGVVSESTQITPSTSPSAPTGVASTISSTSATVTWTVPSDNGGESISEYTAQAFTADASDTSSPLLGLSCVSTSRLSCTISGLTEGSRYKFAVKAKNPNNPYGSWSVLSSQSEIVPISVVPQPPAPNPTPNPAPAPNPNSVGESSAKEAPAPALTPAPAPSPYIGALVKIGRKPKATALVDLVIARSDLKVQFYFQVPKSKSAKSQVVRYAISLSPPKGKSVNKNVRASANKTINTTLTVKKGTTYTSTIIAIAKDGKKTTWKGPKIVVPK